MPASIQTGTSPSICPSLSRAKNLTPRLRAKSITLRYRGSMNFRAMAGEMSVEVLNAMSSQEAEDVDRGLFQQVAEHGNQKIGVGVHHLLDQRRVVVEQLAEPLDARQVAERAEETAPAIGQDHQHVIPLAVAAQPVARVGAEPGGQVGLHPLAPEPAEVGRRLHGIAQELRHRALRVLLHLAQHDPLRIDVGHVNVVLGQHSSLKGRVGHEPRVLDHPAVATEIGGPRVVSPLLRPKVAGLGPRRPGKLLKRRTIAGLIGHRGMEPFEIVHRRCVFR